jgi:hypothetical protein
MKHRVTALLALLVLFVIAVVITIVFFPGSHPKPYRLVIVENNGKQTIVYPHVIKIYDTPQVMEASGVLSWRDGNSDLHMRMSSSFKSWEVVPNK